MFFQYRYLGSSAIQSQSHQTQMAFAPDTLREPTYFIGQLGQHFAFREAISALHHVVISDLRYQPRDKSAYKQWVVEQEKQQLNQVLQRRADLSKQYQDLQQRYQLLQKKEQALLKPFYRAQEKYFKYIYKRDYNAWFVLDPVITVHPDELFFECFSQDESTYGRLSCSYNIFKKINEFACGTTNIDYSAELYTEFQKIRDYKNTQLKIDPSGFEVQTEVQSYQEVKIDLPESWVRGFLQVSSAMTLAATKLELHPMDIYNLCLILRRHKEKTGPRSLRYQLTPDKPIEIIIEPWNIRLSCHRSLYTGNTAQEIRVWGRRRLHVLERLISVVKGFTVYLLGTGMPSFYIAHLEDMDFTLGLSGWTANDWSHVGQFDLMAPRQQVDHMTQDLIFNALKSNWQESAQSLSQRLNLDNSVVLSALGSYAQAGRVIYDINKQVYRVRELSKEPLPLEQLRFASPEEEMAHQLVTQNKVKIKKLTGDTNNGFNVEGQVKEKSRSDTTALVIDKDQALKQATCSCPFYQHNKLYKGPCAHILALRIKAQQQLQPKQTLQLTTTESQSTHNTRKGNYKLEI